MLSRLTARYIILAGNLAWLGGGIPSYFYHYSHGKPPQVVNQKNSKLRLAFEKINKIVNLLYIIFVAFQLFTLKRQGAPISILMRTTYVLVCYTVSVVFEFQAILQGNLPSLFIAEYIKFFKGIQDKYMINFSGVKCNLFLTFLFTVGNFIYLQNFLIMRRVPQTSHFFTSIVGVKYQDVVLLKFPLVLIQCWVWFNLWTNIYFYIFPLYAYTSAGIRLLRELNPNFRHQKSSIYLRERYQFVQVLNTFRVLHTVFTDTYRIWVQPAQKAVTIAIASLALYGVIILNGRQAKIMGFAATFAILYLASVYRNLGLLYEASVQLRTTWLVYIRTSKEKYICRKWMEKYMISVQGFKVHVGQFYFVNKTTVSTILYTILNMTITMLIG